MSNYTPDPAGSFAAAMSLYMEAIEIANKDPGIDLSDAYSGQDQFMRTCANIGSKFEAWACEHIEFSEISDVWPYLLEDNFGKAVMKQVGPEHLADWGSHAQFRVVCHEMGIEKALGVGARRRYKHILVIGRVPDGENSCEVYQDMTQEEAEKRFTDFLYDNSMDDREAIQRLHGVECYIDYVVTSDTEMNVIASQ